LRNHILLNLYPEPEEPPKSKSVVFEDMEDDIEEEESESEEEDSLPGINLTEEDDKVSITDLDEHKPQRIVTTCNGRRS